MMRMTNSDDLIRALRGLDQDVRTRVALDAMRAAAVPVVEEARSRAPRRSGKGAAAIGAGVRQSDELKVQISVGPSADTTTASRREGFYLHFIEVGTVERVTRPRPPRGAMPRGSVTRSPFLRPALDARAGDVKRIVSQHIRRALDQAGR